MKKLTEAQLTKMVIKAIDWNVMMLPRTDKRGKPWTQSKLTKLIAATTARDIINFLYN